MMEQHDDEGALRENDDMMLVVILMMRAASHHVKFGEVDMALDVRGERVPCRYARAEARLCAAPLTPASAPTARGLGVQSRIDHPRITLHTRAPAASMMACASAGHGSSSLTVCTVGISTSQWQSASVPG